jgi:micrococcal nuclease
LVGLWDGGVDLGIVVVLRAMAERRQCERTGLSIPECSCRACCEALLRGCEPKPIPAGSGTSMSEQFVIAALVSVAVAIVGCGSAGVQSAPARQHDFNAPLHATIDYAVDGDTLRVRLPSGGLDYVRLVGIDTPEDVKPGYPSECGSRAAAAAMDRLAPEGATVTLRYDSVADHEDRYGRLLAHAFIGGRELEIIQLRRGFAGVYRYDEQRFDGLSRFEAAERSARREDRGVWGACGGDFHSAEPGLQS